MTSVAAPSAVAQPSTSGLKLTADFNMFLKMLTTQLQYQDPLDPMDTSEYTQQLVSYSQVEQAIQQTGKLESILARMASQDLSAAAAYIGRTVSAEQATAALGDNGASWTYELPAAAENVQLGIYDSRGVLVASEAGATTRGSHTLTWDGLGDDGRALAPGIYSLKVAATSASGTALPATIAVSGRVDSVEAQGGDVILNLGGTPVRAANIRAVGAAS